MNTALTDLAQGKPYRGNGAPSRTRSHYDRILALLRERGTAGVLASELYDHPHFYGRSPRNRLSELRAAGFRIHGEPRGSSDWFYRLEGEPSQTNPTGDWYEREHGPRPSTARAENDLPLFVGVRG